MARLPRLSLAGHPHHVIQRGNDRMAIVRSDEDRLRLLDLISEYAVRCRVALHAYVLMDNHLHLLLTPETAEALPLMMQGVGRRYVRYFNDAHQRSGTLWEGRYKSTLIQADAYLLACMAYIDLNPVRAGMVSEPSQYPWSSHAHHIGLRLDRRITPHPLYWAMGNTPFAREAAYAELVRTGLPSQQKEAITQSVLHGWVLGDPAFVTGLQAKTDRRLSLARPGRPPSKSPPPG